MRFEGTDTALMVVTNDNEKDGDEEDFEAAFKRIYKSEFGFLLDTKSIIVDDVKVNDFFLSFFLPTSLFINKCNNNRFGGLAKHLTRLVNPSMLN